MLSITRASDFHLDSDALNFSITIDESKTVQAHYYTQFTYGFGNPAALDPTTRCYNEESDCVLVIDEPIDGYDIKAIERATDLLCQSLLDAESLQSDYAFDLDHLQAVQLDIDNNVTYKLYDGDNDVKYSA